MGDSKQLVPVELIVANNHLHSRGLAFAQKGRNAKNTKCLSCLLLKNIAIGDGFPEDNKIYLIRGQKVMLDKDLSALYGVSTSVLNKAVSRNLDRFPSDFMLQLTREEFSNLKCHFGTSSWGGSRRAAPYAFIEQGVAMLSGAR